MNKTRINYGRRTLVHDGLRGNQTRTGYAWRAKGHSGNVYRLSGDEVGFNAATPWRAFLAHPDGGIVFAWGRTRARAVADALFAGGD